MGAVRIALLIVVWGCLELQTAWGQASTSSYSFPARDACRRKPQFSGTELLALPPKKGENGTVNFCFKVKRRKECQPEYFSYKGERVQARCCNTTFAKIKMFVDPACRWQFAEGNLIVPASSAKGATNFNKKVSPVWARDLGNNEVKYTQFGPIPYSIVDGTEFCLRMLPGPCKLRDFTGITNPLARKQKVFKVAIYDRKKDGYECCPIFTFPTSP